MINTSISKSYGLAFTWSLEFLPLVSLLSTALGHLSEVAFLALCIFPWCPILHSQHSNCWPLTWLSHSQNYTAPSQKKVQLWIGTSSCLVTSVLPLPALLSLSPHSVQTCCTTHSLSLKYTRKGTAWQPPLPNPQLNTPYKWDRHFLVS